MTVYALTTVDNPFDPIDEFEDWYRFDMNAGYNTSGLLGRLTENYPVSNENDDEKVVEQAIDEFLEVNPVKIYKKVSKEIDDEELIATGKSPFEAYLDKNDIKIGKNLNEDAFQAPRKFV